MLHRRLVIAGQEFCLAAGQCGKGPPTEDTEGCEGATYMDTDTEKMYKCTKCENGKYTWAPLLTGIEGFATDEEVTAMLEDVFGQQNAET